MEWEIIERLKSAGADNYDLDLYYKLRAREIYCEKIISSCDADKLAECLDNVIAFGQRLKEFIYPQSCYVDAARTDLSCLHPSSLNENVGYKVLIRQKHLTNKWKAKHLLCEAFGDPFDRDMYANECEQLNEYIDEIIEKSDMSHYEKIYIEMMRPLTTDFDE